MSAASRIALIGAGNVGLGWAVVFARAGHPVRLYDPDAQALAGSLEAVRGRLEQLRCGGVFDGDIEAVLARISTTDDLDAALEDVVHIQENAPEELALKAKLFAELDRLAGPDAVIASSTSSLTPSTFTEPLAGRSRCLVAHPANPVHLLPVVELVPAPWTSAEVVQRTRNLLASAGRTPVVLNREIDGFLYNRLQGAVLREAYNLLDKGVASTADIDRVMTSGLGLRWSVVGPFETADLNYRGGIREHARRMGEHYRRMAADGDPGRGWATELVARAEAERRAVLPLERWPDRVAWRDRALMSALSAGQRDDGETS